MPRPRPLAWLASALAAAAACGDDGGSANVDGATADAPAIDARELDAHELDAHELDAPPPEAGLAAWWRFEEPSGATVIDATGHGHDGTLTGAGARVAGRVGQALRLQAGHVRVPASAGLDFVDAATVELWLKVPASTLAGGVFNVLSRGTGNGDDLFSMNSSCGNVQNIFQHVSSPPVGTIAPTTECGALVADRWTHLAIVNDGTHARFYLDGVQIDVGSDQGGFLGAIANDLFFGRREQGVFVLPDGTLDEVKWWTVARTAAQICDDAGGELGAGPCVIP